MRVFENKALNWMFGHEEGAGGDVKLKSKKRRSLQCILGKIPLA
jgi:hypothetical protein